jgi:hypothetical protein
MSGASREPEKYSVEEMMERLKAKPSDVSLERGELVTRADGTQVIRMRKRKRRSRQPHKERLERKARYRTLQVSLVLGLIVLIALGAGGLMIYANTSPYRDSLIAKVSAATGAEISIRELRVNPLGAIASEASLEWPSGNVVKSLELKALEAETYLSSFLGKNWSGDELRARDGHLVFHSPEAGVPRRAEVSPNGTPPVTFNRIGISNARVTMGDPTASTFELRDSDASFYPQGRSGHPQLQLGRGKVLIPGWPEYRLDRAFMEFRGDDVEVVSLRLLDPAGNRGSMILSGSLRPYADSASSLSVRVEAFPLSGVVGPGVANLVSATLETVETANQNFLTVGPGAEGPGALEIAFRAIPTSSVELRNFEFLKILAQRLDDPWFERPAFTDVANGAVRREGENVRLSLDVQSKGRMALKGEILAGADFAMTGSLDVGLADAVVDASLEAKFSELFARADDGFRWVTITLAGSTAMPKDSFRGILESTAAASGSSTEPKVGPSFEELTSPR